MTKNINQKFDEGKEIDKKIAQLPPKVKEKFKKDLLDNLYTRGWCKIYGIDYTSITSEDLRRARRATFEEKYSQYSEPTH